MNQSIASHRLSGREWFVILRSSFPIHRSGYMSSDPSQPDLAWRGYSGWAMLPSFLVCLLLSAVLLMSSWFFDEAKGIVHQIGSLTVFALAVAIWIVQLFRWFYRGACYVYRLTPHSLFVDRGFLYN